MSTVSFKWYGDEWKDIMDRVGDAIGYAMGLQIEGIAKDLAPRDSGRLAGSITTSSRLRSSKVQPPAEPSDAVGRDERYTVVGTNVDYAPWPEYGTSRSRAQPYLRPAVDIFKGEALEIATVDGRKEFVKYARTMEKS